MKKELITTLAIVLTSTMVTIPARAGTPAEGNAAGPSLRPSEVTTGCAVGFENEADPGDVIENKEKMDAYGGVDKYYASFERVTPEYFKQKYAEAAEPLKAKIDTTSTETIVSSAIGAVNNHFTTYWVGFYEDYAFDQKMSTDYLNIGRKFSGFEPAVLLHTLLDAYGISNDVWRSSSTGYTFYASVTYNGKTQYVDFVGDAAIIYDTAPIDLYPERFAEMYMGAYKDFID